MISGCPKHASSINTRKAWHTGMLGVLRENSGPLQSDYSDHKVTLKRQGCEVCPRHRAQVAALLKKNVSGIRFEGDEQARVQAFLDTPVQQATSPAPSMAAMDAAGLPLALQLLDEAHADNTIVHSKDPIYNIVRARLFKG